MTKADMSSKLDIEAEFPKNFDHTNVESQLYKKWEDSGIFKADLSSTRPAYTIILPPPNANGSLHVGHAMFTVEDILARWKRLKGFNVLWLPGADHAGFESQYVFEEKLQKDGQSRFDFDRETLYSKIMDFVQDQRFVAYEQLKKCGFSLDWSREKFTLNPDLIDKVYDTFIQLHRDGLIYRDNYLVNYSTHYGSTFSDLETTHIEKKDPLYYIKYGPITVATVRPETIFGDVAIAVHPEDTRYKQYIGQTIDVEIPDMTLHLKVIGDKRVEQEFGTGALKITPAHDPNDFEIAREHKLPLVQVIDLDGKLNEKTGRYQGLYPNQARKAVVEDLQKMGLIEKVDENYIHNVIVTAKGNKPIEPTILPNWFVKVESLYKPVVEVVEKEEIKFTPKRFKKIMMHWLSNVRDWPISRQIVWGIRIPAWYDVIKNPDIQVTFLNAEKKPVMGRVGELLKEYSLSNIEKGLQNLIAPNMATFEVSKEKPGENYIQETNTLDTWFSSGQWPLTTLGYPDSEDFKKFYPTDVMDTGSEIIFLWVARMIMFGLYRAGEIPFKDVYLHATVVDKNGQKMSKSKGNVINPLEVVEMYGADALRMGLIVGSSAGKTSSVSYEKFKGYRNFVNKIWNATRFILMNYDRVGEEVQKLAVEQVKQVRAKGSDAEWYKRIQELEVDTDRKLEKFQFSLAAEQLHNNFWYEFCDKWIEETKNFINDETNSAGAKAEKLGLLIYSLTRYLRMLHPFMPFITEDLWLKLQKLGVVEEDTIQISQ